MTTEQLATKGVETTRKFIQLIASRHPDGPLTPESGYDALHAYSISTPAFWEDLFEFIAPIHTKESTKAPLVPPLHTFDQRTWFPGVSMNYTENLLRAGSSVHCMTETGARETLTGPQLRAKVMSAAAFLRNAGVSQVDSVAAILPNTAAAVIFLLATAAIGAKWAACSPDFGEEAALDRLSQVQPAVLVAGDGYTHKGRPFSKMETAVAVARRLGVRTSIFVPFLDTAAPTPEGWTRVDSVLATQSLSTFQRFPFTHPLFSMFSSGTTGKPKAIVQSAGGVYLNQVKEHLLHVGVGVGDRVLYMTTLAWMMHPWLVSALGAGADIVLYEGNPCYPTKTAVFEAATELGVTVFGTSAVFIDAMSTGDADIRPWPECHAFLSTGAPLAAEGFDFIKSKLPRAKITPISGGTEINGCFLAGSPLVNDCRGVMPCPTLGADVQIWDNAGKRITGECGELVCLTALPSMPLEFIGDTDGSRFHQSYFSRFEGVWTHGDWAHQTEAGFVIHGRSDTTLKPSGVRIGTSEIYRPLSLVTGVEDSIVVGQMKGNNQRIVLFVKLRDGFTLDSTMEKEIRDTIRSATTPRHVPAFILETPYIPQTSNGKKQELVVTDIVNCRRPRTVVSPVIQRFFEQIRDDRL
ncbi:Acetoacetyl-CoA synthase [Carpediemonas membranifera]|uniref:Acetoacetyl-CoA synthase n=1 Tax=Carpediemonas membranifera TaxID=201153 RepID=A0A8J6B4E3_9EUKA|nr:Acetoacetyl-CoA synthase [Carpediemonas membranifera]|eukprot:KAG9389802.1 Acetoacetyl-CoA synthase [Carpediemonas membranifera]